MIKAYYKLVMLSNELKQANGIKAKSRLDCIKKAGQSYTGINAFINHKGMFYLSLTPQKEFIKIDRNRLTEFSLTGGKSLNFSGLYFFEVENSNYCFGYPNGKPKLSNGEPNPVFEFRNDLYLFIVNKQYTEIEILIIPNCKGFAVEYLQSLINGAFEKDIEMLRNSTENFYNY